MSAENILKVPFSKPSISEEEEKAVIEVIRSGWLTTGKVTLEFEKEFSDFMNSTLDDEKQKVISLAVNSNTSGMILAMNACGVKEGTAIITTPYSFVSTAACAKHLGADVIFCDVEKDSYNIDADKIEQIAEKQIYDQHQSLHHGPEFKPPDDKVPFDGEGSKGQYPSDHIGVKHEEIVDL